MKKLPVLAGIVLVALLGVCGVITLYDSLLSVGRMWETPAIRPHEKPIFAMTPGTVPFSGGEALYRAAIEKGRRLPTKLIPANPVEAGKKAYTSFCAPCHGKYLDGMGTVGQSFYPLPRDLRSSEVMDQDNEELFYIISYGMLRMPAMATTVSASDRVAVIHFIRNASSGIER